MKYAEQVGRERLISLAVEGNRLVTRLYRLGITRPALKARIRPVLARASQRAQRRHRAALQALGAEY